MKTGDVIHGFEIIETADLQELNAKGVWARHAESGAELFHVLNDDKENLFAFAFTTYPEDSTGAAHIIEHSVLCGSQRYPLKDAFIVLAQGSLQTYLNAWTFPDKTVYPASSVNESDYFNLMGVYADAVFHPLLSEWTFMQEGWRLVPPDGTTPPEISGVVYNEMKGAYSSLDAYADLWSMKSVLPGTPYEFESGGDPDHIPDLDWEAFREFHRKRYSPSNCRIFLAGNIPTEKQMAFLDEQVLRDLPKGEKTAPPEITKTWTAPREITVPCPAGADAKPMVFVSWKCQSDPADAAEIIALFCLYGILLGHDGSPLGRALIESGLGEDLSPNQGFEMSLRETVFTVGLEGIRDAGAGYAKKVEALIFGELERLCREGIPPEEIEAAMTMMEFSQREIKRAGGPWSLVWLQSSLRGWLHGAKPWTRLLVEPAFAELKKRAADPRYFETLIRTYLLDNPHRALVTLEPETGFLEKKEAARAASLEKKIAAMNGAEIENLRAKNAELEKNQSREDSPALLTAIPHLSRKDLVPDVETVDRRLDDAAGIPLVSHSIYTNGIVYAALAFPVDTLEPEDYPWLDLFSNMVVSLGLPGMDWGEVSGLLARNTGGFSGTLESGSAAPGAADVRFTGRDWLIFQIKSLPEKLKPSLDLVLRLITEADFSDLRRVRDLVLEIKNDIDSSLAPMGHVYAMSRSQMKFTRSLRVIETCSGLEQFFFIHQAADMDTADAAARLAAIRGKLLSRSGLLANLTCSGEHLEKSRRLIGERFGRFGPPRPALPSAGIPAPAGNEAPEVFSASSLQIGFAAAAFPAAAYDTPGHAAEIALSHQLSTGALWEALRMKGGAYGANAAANHLERCLSFSTYRDPDPARSLDAFLPILEKFTVRGGELEKVIIGAYAANTKPQTPRGKGYNDFLRLLHGIDDGMRRRKLERLAALTGGGLTDAARRLRESGPRSPVIIAGRPIAEKAAAKLGVDVKPLPV